MHAGDVLPYVTYVADDAPAYALVEVPRDRNHFTKKNTASDKPREEPRMYA